ncbi:hypothetical protein ATY41_08795 [Leifsonia xyli subsp. xyli]|uniref:Hemagglutinin n=2 Tax=Leifsonia xyli subsp. xyli TaxID=59736 RepID=Q6AEY4_LEIXX|nr:hypothetical protein [Leifsonia xyli]AAT89061.1 conserved hypothetical protein [Leifsonia xyli subsp. xyli str. CTCB07]ODA90735.1 hypothetical protein ATY41_08795 [Leifsonia xyli subsp. xyli]
MVCLRPRSVAAGALAAVALAVFGALPLAPASAATAPSFDPGDIISDDSFFNPDAMTAAQIQGFLDHLDCRPKDDSPCPADYRIDTPDTKASAGRCAALQSERRERASSIVARVAKACTISPRVLLALLQKEQSLLTAPSASGYQKATGYACPDTAACDERYFGFYNQVYRAAWQFREYAAHPGDWRYRIDRNDIQYHPHRSCGSHTVRILNQATANLYNYTPYQPNAETLAHPNGPAGDCSVYGNLNFSRLYNRWFGDPLAVRYRGFVEPCLVYTGGEGCPLPSGFRF